MEYVQGKASTTAEGHRWPTSSTGVMLARCALARWHVGTLAHVLGKWSTYDYVDTYIHAVPCAVAVWQ